MHDYFTSVPPVVSCFALPLSEYHHRTDTAEDLEEQMQAHYNNKSAYGREILWHPAFPAEYVAIVCNLPLTEVSCWHHGLDTWCHNKKPLDLLDYCFLADVLREGLANNPTPVAALRLVRALAWVEQAGTALLAEQAALTHMAATAGTPIMATSAA